jgi:uncharacterized protein YjdB
MRLRTILLCTSLLLGGCAGGYERASAPPADSTLVDLAATSSDVLTSLGDTRPLTAMMRTVDGQALPTYPISWSTSAPEVATVTVTDSGALVTAVGNGTAQITATSGSAQSTIGVTVRQAIVAVVLLHPVSILEPGSTTQFTAVALDARNHRIDAVTNFTFSSPDSSVVDVQTDGKVTALLSPGADSTATIIAEVTRTGVTTTGTTTVRVGRAGAADRRDSRSVALGRLR